MARVAWCRNVKRVERSTGYGYRFEGMLVEGKQSVKGERARTQKVRAKRNVWVYSPAGSYSDDCELAQLGPIHSSHRINIHRCVQFIHYNIDIISPHTGGQNQYFFPLKRASNNSELTSLFSPCNRVKVLRYAANSVGIPNSENQIGNVLTFESKVVNTAVRI
ncbi:MAG: Uncharacterised protein [Flavobacteriales bacterium UBA4585]|nr:MAG: Uncharacterised protein [Flavobacteriales bacterium UBA4585]